MFSQRSKTINTESMEFRFASKVVIAVVLLVFLLFSYPHYIDYKTHQSSNVEQSFFFEDSNRKMIFEEVSRLYLQTGRTNNSTTAAIIKVCSRFRQESLNRVKHSHIRNARRFSLELIFQRIVVFVVQMVLLQL